MLLAMRAFSLEDQMNVQPETIEKIKLCPECGWMLTRHDTIEYRDYDDVKHSVSYLRYSCRRCGLEDIDEQVFHAPIPLPYGVILGDHERPYCVKCGMKLESTPITNYVKEDGTVTHVPSFAGVQCFLCGRMGTCKHEFPEGTDPYFLSMLKIHERVRELWQIDFKELLKSKDKATGEPIFKFCFGPDTREFFFGVKPQNHKTLVAAYGELKFGDYVRGIYFLEKKLIYLREHQNKPWMMQTHFILRRLGVPGEIPIIWGTEAAESLREELAGL
jgi:hypothetical protein